MKRRSWSTAAHNWLALRRHACSTLRREFAAQCVGEAAKTPSPRPKRHYRPILDNQHRIAEAEKPVAVFLRLFICLQENSASSIRVIRVGLADKRAYKHEQAGSRQMKVGYQRVNRPEAIAGPDEQIYASRECRRALPGTGQVYIRINTLRLSRGPLQGVEP